jgi:hypothetical protein
MAKRISIPQSIQDRVLTASARRCCICVFLRDQDEVRKGQIAHLNHNCNDTRFENLVWLCFDHHDEFDSTTTQSKGLTVGEVRQYRERLYEMKELSCAQRRVEAELSKTAAAEFDFEDKRLRNQYARLRRSCDDLSYLDEPWRYPLWQVGNKPDYFAYKAGNRCDGVCLIERIDLPDGRIVIVCIETAGNPGNSITNCVEELCFQICERFALFADRVVWLQHYDYDYADEQEWMMVKFAQLPPQAPFAEPSWMTMTPELWKGLWLKPKRRLTQAHGNYDSKVTKLFPWESESLF